MEVHDPMDLDATKSAVSAAPLAAKPLLQSEGRSLLYIAVLTGGIAAFLALLRLATSEGTHAFDKAVLLSLRNPHDLYDPVGPPWVLDFIRDVTTLAGWPVITLMTVILAGWLGIQRRWGTILIVLLAVIGHSTIVGYVKDAISRDRPSIVPHLVDVASSSVPSGRSTSAAAVYLTLGAIIARGVAKKRALRAYALTVAVLLSLLIGFSRVFLGVHYPTDVLAGLSLGAAWASVIWLAAY
jgi:undecaprenyl-diphosphatase